MDSSTQACFHLFCFSALPVWTSVEGVWKRLYGHMQATQPDMRIDVCSEMRVSESPAHSPLRPMHQAGTMSSQTPLNAVVGRPALLRCSTGDVDSQSVSLKTIDNVG